MHSKQWYYSLHRDFQNCYSTRRSLTRFFSSNSNSNSTRVPIQHLHLHVCTLHYTSIQRILHPEIQFYMQKTESSSSTTTYRGQRDLHSSFQKRNSTHRRQGDLLEMHPCVLQDLPVTFQAFQPQVLTKATPVTPIAPETFHVFPVFPDIPVFPDTPETFRTFQSFMTFQPFQAILQIPQVPVFPGNPPHSSILRLECIFYNFLQILQFDWFPQKLHRVPVGQLQALHYRHYILQRKGDVVISVNFVSVKKMSR